MIQVWLDPYLARPCRGPVSSPEGTLARSSAGSGPVGVLPELLVCSRLSLSQV